MIIEKINYQVLRYDTVLHFTYGLLRIYKVLTDYGLLEIRMRQSDSEVENLENLKRYIVYAVQAKINNNINEIS